MNVSKWAVALLVVTGAFLSAGIQRADAFYYKWEVVQLVQTANAGGAQTTTTLWDNNLVTVKSTGLGGKEKGLQLSKTEAGYINKMFESYQFHAKMEDQVYTAATPAPTGSQSTVIWYDIKDFWSWYYGSYSETETGANHPAQMATLLEYLENVKTRVLAQGTVAASMTGKMTESFSTGQVTFNCYVWNNTSSNVSLAWKSYPQFDLAIYAPNGRREWLYSSTLAPKAGKPANLTISPNSYARYTVTWKPSKPGSWYADSWLTSDPGCHVKDGFVVKPTTN
ncbi:MAG: hypothetical protein HZA54_18895 [Planctomycetes bacterium]|nr:hypothetical protein [Planctomycetota bacterium]